VLELRSQTNLVNIDDWFPELILLFVKVSHTNFTEVTWMILVEIGSMMVLTTS
jgi:hypothetical protein